IPSSNMDFNTITSILFNTKPVEDDWPTPTYLGMESGRYIFVITKLSSSGAATITKVDVGPVIKDQWEDWVMNRDFTSSSSGFVRLYKNGKLVAEYIGPNWKEDGKHSKEPYMQMGLYKWAFGNNHNPTPNVNSVEMYMDEVRFGNQNAKLADFLLDGTTPPPPTNQLPTVNLGTNRSITLPTNSISITGTATDADGSISSFRWSQVSGPSTATISNETTATASFSNLVQGTYSFRLTVTDNAGGTGSATVSVTVNPEAAVNISPVANAGAAITITLPTNTAVLAGSGADEDGTIASYRWRQLSGPNTASISNATAAGTGISNLIQGRYSFRLTVTDNDGASHSDDVLVTVNPAPVDNAAPVSNAGPNRNITLPTNSTNISGSGTDTDGTIASFRWRQVSGPNTAAIANAGAAATTVSGLIQGTYTFRLTVTDNDGATHSDDMNVTVNAAPNTAPTVHAGSNRTITLPSSSTSLSGSATDQDGTIASYQWTQVNGPTTATIGAANSANTTVSGLAEGIYTFRLRATDNDGASGIDEMTVTVNAAASTNQPPVAAAGSNRTITLPTNSVALNGTGTDADGSIAAYRWTQVSGPSTALINPVTAASTTVSGLVEGTYVFRLTVTDNDGATNSDETTVVVKPAPVPNEAPVANAGSNRSITLPTNSITLSGSGRDNDGTITAYRWTQVDGPNTASIGAAAAASTEITNLVEGIYTFRLTVTDNDGARDADDVTVRVNPAPVVAVKKAPVSNAGGKKTVNTKSTTLDGSSSYDPDGSVVSYSWKQNSGPNTATLSSAKSATTTAANLSTGTYVFQLEVTDNDGLKATSTMTLVVLPAPVAPVARAGNAITISLPTNRTELDGSGSSDADGNIRSYRWTQQSGPANAGILTPSSSKTAITNLVVGTYQFQLEVTDNAGLKGTTTVSVRVLANKAPVIVTSDSVEVILPSDTALLDASKSYDPDGTIRLYQWKMVNGPSNAILNNQNSAIVNLSGLVTGIYTFEILVRDNGSITVRKEVTVTVKGSSGKERLSMKLYPNPVASNGIVTLRMDDNSTGKGSVQFYSISGVLVMQDEVNKNTTHFTKTYNLSNFAAGTYVIRVQFEGMPPSVRKFQKQ
ncbi:PKD domain-containing protein, partial [Flavihumibacter sp. CACIAM 22H1]|uniref:PKD domain-containing protein n=1 Tax=Flavihumibacter sp. CACIAM 22H1 TaxID=1812911 RepID=UPI000AED58F3